MLPTDLHLVLIAQSCQILQYPADATYIANCLMARHLQTSLSNGETNNSIQGIGRTEVVHVIVSMASIFLTGKLVESCRNLRDVIVAYKYVEKRFKHDCNNAIDKPKMNTEWQPSLIESFVFDEKYVKLKEDVVRCENYALRLMGFFGAASNRKEADLGQELTLRAPHKYYLTLGRTFSFSVELIHLGVILIDDACTCLELLSPNKPHEIALAAWLVAFNILSANQSKLHSSDTTNSLAQLHPSSLSRPPELIEVCAAMQTSFPSMLEKSNILVGHLSQLKKMVRY